MGAAKAWLAVAAAAVMAVQTVIAGGNGWSLTEFLAVVIAVLGAVTVYLIPNTSEQPWAKGLVALLTAAAEAALAVSGDGIVGNEWLTIALAVFTALGVPMIRNRSDAGIRPQPLG